jgi:large subunit GTPase 1
MSAAEIH